MTLDTLVIPPEGQPERLLLLVHGLGADQHDLAGLAPHLDPEGHFLVACPRGPIPYGPGAAWYDFTQGGADRQSFEASRSALDDLVDALCDEHTLSRSEAVLGGFSQGASLTLALGFGRTTRTRPTGVLVMSGFMAPGLDYAWEAPDKPAVLMQHGTHDPMIPAEAAQDAAHTLEEHGVAVVYIEYPMAHEVVLESVTDARLWLDAIRAGARPAAPVDAAPAAAEPPPDDGPVRTVTSATFAREVLQSEVPVIVDFWAPWCQPCRMVSPVVEHIANMRKGTYKVCKLNIDEAPDIAQTYDVKSIPLIGLFRNGRLERRSLGAKPRQQIEAELGMLVIP